MKLIKHIVLLSVMFGNSHTADIPKKLVGTTQAWLDLALAVQNKKFGLFHKLPSEVQSTIVSYVNPPTCLCLDDWQSGIAIRDQEIVEKNEIRSFSFYGDRLVYVTKAAIAGEHCLHNFNVITGDCFSFNHDLVDKSTISVKLRGDIMLLKQQQRVELYDITKWKSDSIVSHDVYLWFTKQNSFCLHDKYDFCASNDRYGSHMCIYRLNKDKTLNDDGLIHTLKIKDTENIQFSWCPTLPLFAMSLTGSFSVYDCNTATEYNIAGYVKVGRKPQFSYDGRMLYVDHEKGLLEYDISRKEMKIISVQNPESYTLCGVGERYFLMEKKGPSNVHNKRYVLRSYDGNTEFELPFTSAGEYKLPSSSDCRYGTCETTQNCSKISIYKPHINASFQHYCMMQAVIAAHESHNEHVWELFNQAEYADLIRETGEKYTLFKKLTQYLDIIKKGKS